jgi:hypothetical protein
MQGDRGNLEGAHQKAEGTMHGLRICNGTQKAPGAERFLALSLFARK